MIVVTSFLDVCWLATTLINPGITFRPAEEDGVYCETCGVYIDGRESHVSIVGGCVGKNNFIMFKLLVFGFFLWGMSMISILPVAFNM